MRELAFKSLEVDNDVLWLFYERLSSNLRQPMLLKNCSIKIGMVRFV